MTVEKINTTFFTNMMISARIATLFMVIGILFSTALLSIGEFIILVTWILLLVSGHNIKEQLTISFNLPMVKVGLVLLSFIFLHISTSTNVVATSSSQFLHYRELLLLPLLLFILNSHNWKKIIYYSFLAGMTLVLVHSYLQFFSLVPNSPSLDEPNTSTIGRIAGAIMLAFTCYAFLEEALRNKSSYLFWVWLILFFAGSFALLFFYNGRTGALIYFVILFTWGFRFLGKKGIVIAMVLASLISTVLYHTSPSVKSRIDQTHRQLHSLLHIETSPTDPTRVGLYSRTVSMMKKHSMARTILGGGGGSFRSESKQHQFIMTNPHNEYLLAFFENGVIGLLLLLAFFILTWRQSKDIDEHEKWLLRALVITFGIGCLFNSLLLDNREAHFYVLLLATLIPPIKKLNSN